MKKTSSDHQQKYPFDYLDRIKILFEFDPAILFGARPGDLFVVRNVANLVPPYQPDDNYHGISAAIEFGIRDLGVREIVVLGHAFCGGIKALCSHARGEDNKEREFITPWIKIAMPIMDQFSAGLIEKF